MTRKVVALGVASFFAGGAVAQGADTSGGRAIAAGCAACHGTNGVSGTRVPSLAGIPLADIAARMREFKSGQRSGTVMPQLAKGYTDEQIDLLAAWFAAQPAPAK